MGEKGETLPFSQTPDSLKRQSDKIRKTGSASTNVSNWTIFFVIAFYWLTSLSVVFLNKIILSSTEYRFPYPFAVTCFQLAVAFVLLVVGGQLGRVYVPYRLFKSRT
jgi:hypothetical protein